MYTILAKWWMYITYEQLIYTNSAQMLNFFFKSIGISDEICFRNHCSISFPSLGLTGYLPIVSYKKISIADSFPL